MTPDDDGADPTSPPVRMPPPPMSPGLKILGTAIIVLLAVLCVGYLSLATDKDSRDLGQYRQGCIAAANGKGYANIAALIGSLLDPEVLRTMDPEYRRRIKNVDQGRAEQDLLEAADSLNAAQDISSDDEPCP